MPAKRIVVRHRQHVLLLGAQGRQRLGRARYRVVVIDERAVEIEQIRGVVGKWAAD